MPVVSAIMLFHRDTPFLRPAIASALGQTWRDLELILVDNGTGLTADALGELGRDPRLRWLRLSSNAGIPAGHNAGVAAATGEYVALMDYDDISLPGRFSAEVAALRTNSTLGFVSGLAERIDATGRRHGREFCLLEPEAHRAYTLYNAAMVTPAGMGRREVFTALPYRTCFPFSSDLDFQARLVERWNTAVLREVVLHYRWYPEQTTQHCAPKIEQSRCAIQLLAARRRAGRPEDLKAALKLLTAASAAESWRRVAVRSLEEGFYVPAAFQARRSFAMDRTWGAALTAMRLGWRAVRGAPATERGLALRMFFTGPVRALRLQPA